MTSDLVAALRALYSEAPPELAIFDDAVAARLIPAPLRVVVNGAASVPFGVRVTHRVLSAVTRGMSEGIPLRTAAIDDAVRRSIDAGVRQLVLLGAGLDARAWRMPALGAATVFEIDHPDTQSYKRERTVDLEPLAREVRFCPIDFERDTIEGVLFSHGFDAKQKSVWIWEGVTMYLTPESIASTLDAVAGLASRGSRVAITYLPREWGAAWVRTIGEAAADLVGEAIRSRLEPAEIAEQLSSRGFQVESDDSAREWATRWPERERARVRPIERLVVAERS